MSIWDTIPGLLERHRELYDEHRTHSQIGRILTDEFAVEVTRNASIGKTQRMKYPPRAKKKEQTSTGREGKRPNLKSKPLPKPKPESDAMNIPMVKIRRKRRMNGRYCKIATFPLTDHTCKWPVSGTGADTRFCGHACEHGSSYCTAHRKRSESHRVQRAVMSDEERARMFQRYQKRFGNTSKKERLVGMDVADFWKGQAAE